MLAGCQGRPGSRPSRLPWLPPSSCISRVSSIGQVFPPRSTSAPNLQPCVVPSVLFCTPCTLLLWIEQGWDDAETCAGQLELELAAQGLRLLGRIGRRDSHAFTLCLLFCSSSLLLGLIPFSSSQDCFLLLFSSFL